MKAAECSEKLISISRFLNADTPVLLEFGRSDDGVLHSADSACSTTSRVVLTLGEPLGAACARCDFGVMFTLSTLGGTQFKVDLVERTLSSIEKLGEEFELKDAQRALDNVAMLKDALGVNYTKAVLAELEQRRDQVLSQVYQTAYAVDLGVYQAAGDKHLERYNLREYRARRDERFNKLYKVVLHQSTPWVEFLVGGGVGDGGVLCYIDSLGTNYVVMVRSREPIEAK